MAANYKKEVIARMDTPKYGETLRDTLTGTNRFRQRINAGSGTDL